ncbi:MAG: patatin-like phospholipase family protein [Bacteroidota bacterium]
MGPIKQPKDVRYLAFEGGGGKGVTYLGAIKALTKLGVLPIDPNRPGANQIKGISGSSAGAITALFLAMGYGYKELKAELENPQTFLDFFDGPDLGQSRMVDSKNEPVRKRIGQEQMRANLTLYHDSVLDNIVKYLPLLLGDQHSPIIRTIQENPHQYINNLLFEKGLFPGFTVREYFQKKVAQRFVPKDRTYSTFIPDSFIRMPFKEFYLKTGVDLVITGVNTTKKQPGIFSKDVTPHFPVAEAVGISMSLPLLFKPVAVNARVPTSETITSTRAYEGDWVDGGVLNNFPLHAFDLLGPQVSDKYPELRPLHPQMLGLRLTEPVPKKVKSESLFGPLLAYVGDLFGTFMHGSEEGQIRNRSEALQTINLDTGTLGTTDFAPDPAVAAQQQRMAEKTVLAYFKDA